MNEAQRAEALRLAGPEHSSEEWRSEEDIDAAFVLLRTLAAQPQEQSLSQRMRAAGYTPRDRRLTCDECGAKFTAQMAPLHECAAPVAQPSPMLSDEQIDSLHCDYVRIVGDQIVGLHDFARAILAAAGAKQAVALSPLTDEPKVGETWHILREGATACATLTIEEVTKHTVVFKSTISGLDPERLPRNGVKFVERAVGAARSRSERRKVSRCRQRL